MGEVSEEGLEDSLERVINRLNRSWSEHAPRDYVEAIKKEGWVPATRVARSRALMEDAQRALAREKTKREAVEVELGAAEEKLRELMEEEKNRAPRAGAKKHKTTITFTPTLNSGAIGTITGGALTDSINPRWLSRNPILPMTSFERTL